jgi:hypothetical protein
MDHVTIKSDELDARVEELRTESAWRAALWIVAAAGVIVALAVAVSVYVAYAG